MNKSYKSAGVDIEAGYKAVSLMRQYVAKTMTKGVLSGIGGFNGLFELNVEKFKKPVLVSGTDGVGTKLKIAILMDKHDTIGEDCVAMCVNDIICSGAEPLIFLDYIAVGKNIPEKVADIVKGVSNGCIKAGCALVGGETAEMPGFYGNDDYDMAGFALGAVEKSKIIDGSNLKSGDVLIGIGSSGVHSNGYSLLRKIFNIDNGSGRLNMHLDDLGCTLGEELLTPTKIYVKTVLSLIENFEIKAISHITGGGFYENIPRMLPLNLKAEIQPDSFYIPPIFDIIESEGAVPRQDMFATFNMGVGMALAVSKDDAEQICAHIKNCGDSAYIIGELKEGNRGVEIC
ncbi:MAG: phosphoribosylformylglycinamidine cyclo-ligase [Firmicutes bacterium]|nr:phosphoribosylformylglycinamidine cyclo-ligase [Bacillota bacterium]